MQSGAKLPEELEKFLNENPLRTLPCLIPIRSRLRCQLRICGDRQLIDPLIVKIYLRMKVDKLGTDSIQNFIQL